MPNIFARAAANESLARFAQRVALVCGLMLAGPMASSADPARFGQEFVPPKGVDVPCNELERRMFLDAADGTLDEHSLAAAALIASGVDDPDLLDQYVRRIGDLSDQLSHYVHAGDDPFDRARALFDFMHREILRGGYRVDASDMTRVLDEGEFNCISSAVLLRCLAGPLKLDVEGVEVPGHAFSVLRLPNGPIDVETTCSSWFDVLGDPGGRRALVAKETGFAGDHRSDLRRALSDAGLVAIIYYNRGVGRLGREEFAAAVSANFKALWLDPNNPTAAQNLAAAFNNWALYLNDRRAFAEALEILDQGLEVAPDDKRIADNRQAVLLEWAADHQRHGRLHEALDVLDRACRELPAEKSLTAARFAVYRRQGSAILSTRHIEEAIRRATYGTTPGGLHPSLVNNVRYAYHHWATALADKDNSRAAVRLALTAVEDPFLLGSFESASESADHAL